MRIQHNIAALNSHRQLTNNNSAVSKNLEKLSSGYRINRAGDDAAGLAISEKMRAQITGLNTASKNAQDGISLVQTAEGALTEVHSMLNRMTELADQSANGTYQDLVDRENIQKELDSLAKEIDRISSGTNFNGIKLLDGSLDGGSAAKAVNMTATIAGVEVTETTTAATKSEFTSGAVSGTGTAGTDNYVVTYTDANNQKVTATIAVKMAAGDDDTAMATKVINALKADAGLSGLFDITGDETGIIFNAKTAGNGAVIKSVAVAAAGAGGSSIAAGTGTAGTDEVKAFNFSGTMKAGDKVTIGSETYTFKAGSDGSDGKTFEDLDALKAAAEKSGKYELDITTPGKVTVEQKAVAATGSSLTLQIGEDSQTFNQLSVSVGSMSTASLGIGDLKVNTQAAAQTAIDKIKTAINTVSSTRGDLGAIQNRLEHTINNLGVTAENMSAAESRIRDVDMAQEMMAFTKNNILTQASQSMLAQANQLPQGVLQLLQ